MASIKPIFIGWLSQMKELKKKKRALTLAAKTNTSNDEGKEIKAIYLFHKNP